MRNFAADSSTTQAAKEAENDVLRPFAALRCAVGGAGFRARLGPRTQKE